MNTNIIPEGWKLVPEDFWADHSSPGVHERYRIPHYTRRGGLAERSNREAIIAMCDYAMSHVDDDIDNLYIISRDATGEIIEMREMEILPTDVIEAMEGLRSGNPMIDESIFCLLEHEIYEQSWEDFSRDDYRDRLVQDGIIGDDTSDDFIDEMFAHFSDGDIGESESNYWVFPRWARPLRT